MPLLQAIEIFGRTIASVATAVFSLIPFFQQLSDFKDAAIVTIFGVPAILLTIYGYCKLIQKFIKLFR